MAAIFQRILAAGGLGLALMHPVFAEPPTFAELLARAEEQAATGHRWAPAGDNMTETVANMMSLISTATPNQLAELSALLESDAAHLPPAPESPSGEAAGTPPPTAAPAEPQGTTATAAQQGSEQANPAPAPQQDMATSPAQPNPAPAPQADSATTTQSTAEPPTMAPAAQPTSLPTTGGPASVTTETTPFVRPDHSAGNAATMGAVAAAPAAPHIGPRAAILLARGEAAERMGDVSGARRFYAGAVEQGSPVAARNLGRLYDPSYLKETAIGGIDPDPVLARHWYELALAMGDPLAGPLLESLALR